MDFENLTVAHEGVVAIVSVNRPKALNALSSKTVTELLELSTELEMNPGVRAVILTGRDAGVASTFAEFASEGLVAVDPLDVPGMAEALCDALAGRPGRVSDRFIQEIRRRDAQAWATGFLAALEGPC